MIPQHTTASLPRGELQKNSLGYTVAWIPKHAFPMPEESPCLRYPW